MVTVMRESNFDAGTKLRLGRLLAKTVAKYFEDASHRAEYEKWYRDKYGKEYVWKYAERK